MALSEGAQQIYKPHPKIEVGETPASRDPTRIGDVPRQAIGSDTMLGFILKPVGVK